MAGTGWLTTDEAVRMSRFAEDVGADAVIVVPITYWPLTENEVYEHYSSIAKAIKIPVVITRIIRALPASILNQRCSPALQIDNIQGVKESSGDLSRITQIRHLTKGKMTVFHGWGAGHAPGLLRRRRRLVPRPAEHPPARMRAAIRSLRGEKGPTRRAGTIRPDVPDLQADGRHRLYSRRS